MTNKKNGNIDSAINPKLDGEAHVAWAQAWSSISPETSLLAWVDWASHLANSPGKQAELLAFAASLSEKFLTNNDDKIPNKTKITTYNKKLGTFELTGLPPTPHNIPQIKVTFDINTNNIIHITTKNLKTNKKQSITITNNNTLPKKNIKHRIS